MGRPREHFSVQFCAIFVHKYRVNPTQRQAWFSYAAEVPATWPLVLPAILLRHMRTQPRRQQETSQSLPPACLRVQLRRHAGG